MKIYVGKDDNGMICLFNEKPILRRNGRFENEWIPDQTSRGTYVDISEILDKEGASMIEVELSELEAKQ